jgi:hypothetical protein
MKTRTLIYVSILFLAAILLFAEDVKRSISETEFFEVFSGTWVNEDYSGVGDFEQKLVLYPDGRWETYLLLTDDQRRCYGKYTMDAMWVDSNGDVWFKSRWECFVCKWKFFVLGKISNSGTVSEHVSQGSRYPTEISPIEGLYNIRYRQ